MAEQTDKEIWEYMCNQVQKYPRVCPLCFQGFNNSEEKSRHLEDAHGYETLHIPVPEGVSSPPTGSEEPK